MDYRKLGRTGLDISEISFGAVEIGLAYGIPVDGKVEKPSEKEAHDLLHTALDMGINFVDTARAYGESEEIIGRALKGRRDEYILATKSNHFSDRGLSVKELQDAIRESLETSLRMLQTDVIDVFQIHNITKDVVERGDVLQVVQDAQKAGKIRFTGGTVYGVDDPLAVVEDGSWDVIQVAYNMLDRRLESKVLPLAAAKGVAVTVRSVLLKGALTPRYASLPADSLLELKTAAAKLDEIAQRECDSLAEAAFRYVLANPNVSSALVGTGKLRNLRRSAEYASKGALSNELLESIRTVQIADTNQLNPGTWVIQENYGNKR